jgi:hypothetical protein
MTVTIHARDCLRVCDHRQGSAMVKLEQQEAANRLDHGSTRALLTYLGRTCLLFCCLMVQTEMGGTGSFPVYDCCPLPIDLGLLWCWLSNAAGIHQALRQAPSRATAQQHCFVSRLEQRRRKS